MLTYPVGKRRPVIEDIPEEPDYIEEEEFNLPPVTRQPQRRSVQRYREEQPEYRGMEQEYDRRPERRSIDRVTLIAFVLFFIMLASTIGMAMYSNGTTNDLQDTKWDLSQKEKALNATEKSLANMTILATARNHTIFLLTENLTAKINTLTLTKQSLNSTKHILNDTMAEVNRLMTNNTQLRTQVLLWKTLHPYNVDNPTYAAFKSFYQNDTTNLHPYVNVTYTCEHFARDFKANASSHGIRCAFIILDLNGTAGHCINAVSTTNQGMVYIEPQSDVEISVTPVVGGIFQGKLIKSVVVIW